MRGDFWQELILPPPSDEDDVWELFHCNSRVSQHGYFMRNEEVADEMSRMAVSLDYEGRPLIPVPPDLAALSAPLGEAMVGRVTPKSIEPGAISMASLGSILFAACGITRSNESNSFLRPFRTAPSGGGLFPLELYLSTKRVSGLDAGLYHFNPSLQALRLLRPGDWSHELARTLVEFQAHLADEASLIVMITAMFHRSTFKYGARGYRFALLEAGHVAQNINLACSALGLGCYNVGGFYDQKVDDFLGLDGLNHASIYLQAIGHLAEMHEAPQPPASA